MTTVYVAGFEREEDLRAAVKAAKNSRWPVLEAYTPYPVHGLSEDLGLHPSQLGKACFVFGILGVVLAVVLQYWVTTTNWPLNIGGQPWNSLPAFLPVTFEMMVLFAGLGLVATWLMRCRLYPGSRSWSPRRGETDDRFVLVLGQPVAVTDAAEFRGHLRDSLATTLEELEC
jgi:hypothetical protein